MTEEIQFLWKALSRAKVPGKVKVCVWRCLNALPSRVNMRNRRVISDNYCPFCANVPETIEWTIVLLTCSSNLVFQSFGIANVAAQRSWIPRLAGAEIQLQAHTWLLKFKKWNVVHKHDKPNVVHTWRRSEEGWFKCNVDGAWDERAAVGGVGVIIRNAARDFIEALAMKMTAVGSPMQAEIAAAPEAAVFALQWMTEQLILEGDALLVIAAIQNKAMVNHGSFGHLLEDTRRILQSFKTWKAGYVRRDANSVAHRLARFGLTLEHPVSWFEDPLI
ncbi:uncharacterized protein [Malus domestica]|uniref:uncharacterized protein n=1 Tax=Malus domestica TaxID=3750 RepID=UPI003976198E